MSFGRFECACVSVLLLFLVPLLPPMPGLDPSFFFSTQPPIVLYDATATPTDFLVFPAMGNKRSRFFAPKSTVWSPPKPLQSLAVNTEPMECNAPLSPSPVPPPILPDITLFQSDQHALPMLHQLLATLTAPDVVYMDNVIPTTFLYTGVASQRSTPGPDLKKNYLTLMRLCHPDRHPGIDRHISQQLISVHNILSDPVTRKIYDCCGVRAMTRKTTTHFSKCVTPALFTNPSTTFGNDLQPAMTQCADAFFKEGCKRTNTNGNISISHFIYAKVDLIFHFGHLFFSADICFQACHFVKLKFPSYLIVRQ